MTGDELLQLGNDILDGKVELFYPRGTAKTEAEIICSAVILAAMVRKINALNQKIEETQS